MMKSLIHGRLHRSSALLAAVVLVGLPARAMGPPHHHNRKQAHAQILALEDQWRQAALSNDVTAMDKLLSDDYLGITANGDLVTKEQWLDRMRNRNLSITQLQSSDVKIKLIGSIAIVTSLAQVQGMADGQPLTGSFRYTRVYQRLPSGVWNITSFETTRIPHSGGGGNRQRASADDSRQH